ncbi:MAG: PEP-utilizing enzyme [Acidimicrobiales bacterium]
MSAEELTWTAPGEGVWWLTREHFPRPVSRLFAALFSPVTVGWEQGAARYGLPMGEARWAAVNGWLYFSPGSPDPTSYPALDDAAGETVASYRWRDEVRRWFERERPAVVEANRALQAVEPARLDDDALAAHLDRAIAHFGSAATLHFEHTGFDIAAGRLLLAAAEWGLETAPLTELFAGSSPASLANVAHLDRIAGALVATGVSEPDSLDAVRAASPAAADALDAYLGDCGWRLLEGHDLAEPTLGERPGIVLASLRARLSVPAGRSAPGAVDVDAIRSRVPDTDRDRFDELLADARLTYQLRDDDVSVCFNWPLGLVRRAVLEAAGRLVARGVLADGAHLFEAEPPELLALLDGVGPPGAELAERAERRRTAGGAQPPSQLGEPLPPPADVPLPASVTVLVAARDAYWAAGWSPAGPSASSELQGTGIGDASYEGRACVIESGPDALADLRPGDVLVATATTTAHNAVFPLVGAVATEEGGLFSHAAILAREFGLPAVVGVAGLLDHVRTGDLVEIDSRTGRVGIIERNPAVHPPAIT